MQSHHDENFFVFILSCVFEIPPEKNLNGQGRTPFADMPSQSSIISGSYLGAFKTSVQGSRLNELIFLYESQKVDARS